MTDQPYRPPSTLSENAGDVTAPTHRASLLPYAQLGIRLLGVMFFVDGLSAIFGGLIQNMFQTWAYAESGYDVTVDPHSAGWAAVGLPYLVSGLYLMIGGNWLLCAIFTSPTVSRKIDDTDRKSNPAESNANG